ncbi:MAG: hypothetical protein GF355_01145 [Candidatus Eisenbacteria bacterium]|nr:hypothetical protein [Candidatus Eisenbacteria bacterium]
MSGGGSARGARSRWARRSGVGSRAHPWSGCNRPCAGHKKCKRSTWLLDPAPVCYIDTRGGGGDRSRGREAGIEEEEAVTIGMTPQQFLSYFSEKRFVRDLKARTKDAVLQEMTDLLAREREVHDPQLLLEMLKRRETLGSTGIGHGVAIPHGRTLATGKVKVAFGLSKRGLPFDAIDDQPVHLIFLIVAPYRDPKNEYLPLLGKIVESVKTESAREALMQVETFEDLKSVFAETIHE